MPIVPPELDDLRFDRIVEELKRRIPVYAPEWTDHNDSDPGITLIQLFAYLAEQVGYRLNRVPEKNHVELLKLMGIRLEPAHAAHSTIAMLLSNPVTLVGYTLKAGARVRAKQGTPPPVFETDVDVDIVPAEPVVLVSTKNPRIDDLHLLDDGTYEVQPAGTTDYLEWLAVTWDGKAPKAKDMPTDPVALYGDDAHRYVWIGLTYNPALDAGFRGVRVRMTLQLDDDEKPDLAKDVTCGCGTVTGESPTFPDWLAYYDHATGQVERVTGRIDDATAQWTRSGEVAFTVPDTIGAVAAWKPLRDVGALTPIEACLSMGQEMSNKALTLGTLPQLTANDYRSVLDAGLLAIKDAQNKVLPMIPHPLDPGLQAKASAWLRIRLPDRVAGTPSPRVRIVSFNVVPVTNALTVTNELIGRGDGRPGQEFSLVNQNVLAGTLRIEMQEDSDVTVPLKKWNEVPSLDAAGPLDSVFEVDLEAGKVRFGDGQDPGRSPGTGGRIPPLVPGTGDIVAVRYRWGGGKAGEVPVAAITQLETGAAGIAGVVNFVAATGGRDAETLEQAKKRARKELSTRSRAVTAADFEWIALRTQSVRVARAHVVPLRRPLAPDAAVPAPPSTPRCGETISAGPHGLAAGVAPGAVTVVVVPDEDGPEPTPTPSFLRAVCRQLDGHRLVTTEVHVVPPQFCRICTVLVTVRAVPGYTRSALQTLIEARLGTYLHVLRGGEKGTGFPFGGQLHVADLIAQVFRTEGVARVEQLAADFTRTRSLASPREGQLVLCPSLSGQVDRLELGPEENVSIDVTTIRVTTVA